MQSVCQKLSMSLYHKNKGNAKYLTKTCNQKQYNLTKPNILAYLYWGYYSLVRTELFEYHVEFY
jgi:hypothetical protein